MKKLKKSARCISFINSSKKLSNYIHMAEQTIMQAAKDGNLAFLRTAWGTNPFVSTEMFVPPMDSSNDDYTIQQMLDTPFGIAMINGHVDTCQWFLDNFPQVKTYAYGIADLHKI